MNRVLVLIKGLGRGGAEQLLVSAAPYLDTERFEYEFAYVLREKDDLVPDLEKLGFGVRCLGGRRRGEWIHRLRADVRRREPDVVHAHSPYVASLARLALPPRGPRMVYTEHNVWDSYHPLTSFANLVTYPRNDHVFAVSHDVAASIRYPAGLRFRKLPPIETLHHGIDQASFGTQVPSDGVRAEFGIPKGSPFIATVGSFKPQKDHGNLIRAMARVRRRLPDARLVLVGDGAGREGLEHLVSSAGLQEAVVFAGHRDDAQRIAAACDVFVLSSRHEGLSIALLEAMALGRPVVVTRVGGLPEVVEHGHQGFVVPPQDPAALGQAMIKLLADTGLRERMGRAAGERARAFDIRDAVTRMEQVYEELMR